MNDAAYHAYLPTLPPVDDLIRARKKRRGSMAKNKRRGGRSGRWAGKTARARRRTAARRHVWQQRRRKPLRRAL